MTTTNDLINATATIARHDRYEAALHAIYRITAKGPLKALTKTETRAVAKAVREALGFATTGKADGAE